MITQPYTYMQALEDQLRGATGLRNILNMKDPGAFQDLRQIFQRDLTILQHATPYAWAQMPVQAVLEASKTIPLDTRINEWNMPQDVFWHFEIPLPIRTLNFEHTDSGIKAITVALLKHRCSSGEIQNFYQIGSWFDTTTTGFIPSTSFQWPAGETIEEMLERARESHYKSYEAPGAPFADRPHSTPEITLGAVRTLAQFIVAGHIWLNEKILLTGEGHVERHRRKDFNRQTGQSLTHVRLVDLRKAELIQSDEEPTSESGRTYTHRWVVSGHWRQQPCGPHLSQRKLTYVIPHMKGPEGAPLLTVKPVVYKVDR